VDEIIKVAKVPTLESMTLKIWKYDAELQNNIRVMVSKVNPSVKIAFEFYN
jgi:hypothetical protein